MEVFGYLNTVISDMPRFIRTHPIHFGAALICMLLYTAITLFGSWTKVRESHSRPVKAWYMATILLGCIFMYPIAIVFIVADEVTRLNPGIVSDRFLIECIVIIAIYSTLLAIAELAKKNQKDIKVRAWSAFWLVFYGAIFIGASVLFIHTDAEISLQGWGFSLFGKYLGQWVFNAYLAVILAFLFKFAKEIIFIPFVAIFGDPGEDIRAWAEGEQRQERK